MNKQPKKTRQAFTLVELVVVITILAILWTIAFISIQWYRIKSRDSMRINDIKTMKTWLELYHLQVWKYPSPSNGTNITYSWWVVWTQWIFWDSVTQKISKLNKTPKDPLTEIEYSYSLLNTKQKFELVWVLEWELISLNNVDTINKLYLPQANAENLKLWTAYSSWNYNWQVAKIIVWGITYLLAIPVITTSDLLTA